MLEVVSGQIQSVKLMQNWSPTEPDIPPPYTVYVHTVNIHTGKVGGGGGGRVEPERRERGNTEEFFRSQSWVENTNITECPKNWLSPFYKLR
jgi:hypothetical protein